MPEILTPLNEDDSIEKFKADSAYVHPAGLGPFCPHCWGNHEPDDAQCWVEWQGRKFKPPFLCLCCGKGTCMRQFAYGRTCAPCDTGSCNPANRNHIPQYAHSRFDSKAYIATQEILEQSK